MVAGCPHTLAVCYGQGASNVAVNYVPLPMLATSTESGATPSAATPPPAPSPPAISVSLPGDNMAGTVSSVCWLSGCRALAVGAADGVVHVWRVPGAADGASSLATPAQAGVAGDLEGGAVPSPPASSGDPMLLTVLKGHSDQVLGMVSPTTPTTPAAPAAQLTWLFTAARDQAVRAWVMDINKLEAQADARAAAAAATAAAAAAAAAQAASLQPESGPMATTADDGSQVTTAGGAGVGDVGATLAGTGAGGDVQGLVASSEVAAAGLESSQLPACMTSAPTSSILVGSVGGKGKKKGAGLGAKPLLPEVRQTGQNTIKKCGGDYCRALDNAHTQPRSTCGVMEARRAPLTSPYLTLPYCCMAVCPCGLAAQRQPTVHCACLHRCLPAR